MARQCGGCRPRLRARAVHLALALAALTVVSGCSTPSRLRTRDRYATGVVYVLPGIEGKSIFNRNVALGLDRGGVQSAIEVYDWTTGIPGAFLANLTFYERNQRQAERLARRITTRLRRDPQCAVHLIGHSAGGGVVVMTLEALPSDVKVDSAILLAPALSPDYDLSRALRHTRHGIYNMYSPLDVGFLGVGTTVFGSVDRDRGPSAGVVGFEKPERIGQDDQRLYDELLHQVKWTPRLLEYGANGTHTGWASKEFARSYLAPIIISDVSGRALPARYFE